MTATTKFIITRDKKNVASENKIDWNGPSILILKSP
jgi:hypothetical protein